MRKNHLLSLIAIMFFTLLCSSCKTGTVPSIHNNESMQYNPGAVIWHDLITPDADASKKFYNKLFGWDYKDFVIQKQNYVIIYEDGIAIGGMMEIPTAKTAIWISAVSSQNMSRDISSIKENGGKVLIGPIQIPGRGKQVILQGNQGEKFSLLNAINGDPIQGNTSWLWSEFWAENPSQGKNFYEKVFQVNAVKTTSDAKDYWVFKKDENSKAGMIQNPITNVNSQWVPYINSSDVSASVNIAKENGAYIILEPTDDVRNGKVGIISDNFGATVCIQHYN